MITEINGYIQKHKSLKMILLSHNVIMYNVIYVYIQEMFEKKAPVLPVLDETLT